MSEPAVIAFNVIAILGLVLDFVVLLTAWGSAKVLRTPTWFSFMISAVTCGGSNIIILGQQTGPDPAKWACFMQAILIYPQVVFSTLSSCAMLAQMYYSVLCIERSRTIPKSRVILLTSIPIAITIGVLILSATVAGLRPSIVERDPSGMRCHFIDSASTTFHITIGISLLGVLLILLFQTLLVIKLYRNKSAMAKGLKEFRFPQSVIVRAGFYNVILMVSVIVCTFGFKGTVPSSVANNLQIALLTVLTGILFGFQKDILSVWISWLPERYNILRRDKRYVPA